MGNRLLTRGELKEHSILLQTSEGTYEESAGCEEEAGQVVLVGELPLKAQKSLYLALEELGLEVISVVPRRGRLSVQLPGETDFVLAVATEPAATAVLCASVLERALPPLILIGSSASEDSLVAGLEAGALDFIDCTWSTALLVSKLRRLLLSARGQREKSQNVIRIRDLAIDLVEHRVRLGGEDVPLTPTEFRLLACLAKNAGSVVPAPMLLSEAQRYNCGDQEAQEIVKVHMHRLRQKIERDHARPSYIVNVRGVGYMLERRGKV